MYFQHPEIFPKRKKN